MSRMSLSALTVVVLAGALALAPSLPESAPFSVIVPDQMVTGSVLLEARTSDASVTAVKWYVDDWARTTPRPFNLVLDVGPLPRERRVRAVALGSARQPLYQREAVLNRGGRGLGVEILSPVSGAQTSGPTRVAVRVSLPGADDVQTLEAELGGRRLVLSRRGELFETIAEVPPAPGAIVVHLKTSHGLEAESKVLLNARGFLSSTETHMVEQMVAVTKGGKPVENLLPADFRVRDEQGDCEVREARLVKDTPLALGFALDTSLSLRDNEPLLQATASRFIDQCFKSRDAAFVTAFGPAVTRLGDWTDSILKLKEKFQNLPNWSGPGTELHEAIVRSLYQFQGGHEARALILVTDGQDYEGSMSEKDALDYARESGVKIYALGISARMPVDPPPQKPLADGTPAPRPTPTLVDVPPSMEVLRRFADATGGHAYQVGKGMDMRTIFQQIERDIRTQYLVSYVSNARSRNRFHPVEVKTSRGTVQTAAGFF